MVKGVRATRTTISLVLMALLAGGWSLELRAVAQGPLRESLKLYVLDCGLLKRGEPKSYGLTTEQVGGVTDFFDGCYLVAHPKGLLLWDAGIVPDALIKPGSEREGTSIPGNNWAFTPLKRQLAALGVQPSAVTFLAMSHSHADHVANANDYAASTWLVQRREHELMFGGSQQADRGGAPARANGAAANYEALRNSKTILLDGDHDVFGDGTVVIKATPGHTPGHQSLFVNLPKTGPILLSGDLFHYAAERTLAKVPTMDNREETERSRAAIEALLKKTGAQLWIQHDLVASQKLKKAPLFYD